MVWGGIGVAAIAGIAGVVGSMDVLDGRWNQKQEVKVLNESVQESVKSVWILRRDILYRELVWLEVQGESRTLSDGEMRRKAELKADIERIDREYGGG